MGKPKTHYRLGTAPACGAVVMHTVVMSDDWRDVDCRNCMRRFCAPLEYRTETATHSVRGSWADQ